MARFNQKDKTAAIARELAAPGTAKSPQSFQVVVTVNTTSTATAATNWQNPFQNVVFVKPSVFVSTAGTGTFILGTGQAGTGSSAAFMAAGTLAVGVQSRFTVVGTVAASATAGNTDLAWIGIAASGTAGDTVVMQHSDTPTSTMVAYLIVDVINPGA